MSQRQAKRIRAMEQQLAQQKCELMVLRSHIFRNREDIDGICNDLEKAYKPQKGIKSLLTRRKLKSSFLG